MLKNIKDRLKSRQNALPVISEDPTIDELEELLNNHEAVASGFFKQVYETDQYVVKLPDYPGAMEGAKQQLDNIENEEICPETCVGFYDLVIAGYSSETPVAIQEKYDSAMADLSDSEINIFLEGAVNTIDAALQDNVVLQDAKITNFGMFDDEIKYIDITDKESLTSFNTPENRSEKEQIEFLANASSMYDSFTRTVSRNTDLSREQVVHYVTQQSNFLDESIEIKLPEESLMTGLEQRLNCEVTGTPESTY